MQVGILGPVRLSDGDTVVAVGGARLRALLTRLALEPGTVVAVPALVDAVWPDQPPGDPVNAVQTLVSRLRRLLPAGTRVRQVAGGYRLELAADDVDAERFERLARTGRDRLRAGAPADATPALREALALWRGRPLADLDGAAVAGPVVARLDELRLAAAEDLAEAELTAGPGVTQAADVAVRLRALIAEQPLRERLRALHVRALVAAGRRAEALAAVEDARALLADQLGTDPGAELRAAHLDALRDDEPAASRPALPVPLTPLIGRDGDVAGVTTALGRARLVTLTGPGGAGKTRLAVAAAATLPTPVRLVELAAVADPDDVAQAAADALLAQAPPGTVEPPARTATERLVETLGGGESVLLLDNCEHLVDAAAALAGELLRRCPRLRVLTTSREPLRLPGEALYEVRPLAEADAVRLFTERARDVRPELELDSTLVAEVCRRLDGLPLAVELAAARLRSLPLPELSRRLGDRFGVLTRGARTADQRHRTLRDLVAWSWELLTEPERTLLERLGVVPVVTPATAAAQGGPDAPDLLAALVDKSLLQLADDGPEPRYRMLETIREFALARLTESGARPAAEAALVASVLDLLERAEPRLRTPDQLRQLPVLRAERENLRSAVQVATAADVATAVRLGAALAQFWTVSSDHSAAAHRLRRLLDLDGPADPDHRGIVATYYVFNALLGGHNPEALAIAARLRAWVGAAGSGAHPVLTLAEPLLALLTDDIETGLAATDRPAGGADDWTRGGLLLVRSMLRGTSGDMRSASASLAEAARAYRAAGELWGESTSLTFLALMQTMYADPRAAEALDRAIRLRQVFDPADEAIEQRAWLAQLHAWTGAPERARTELTALLDTDAAASVHCVILVRVLLGDLDRLAGDLVGAGRWYEAAAEQAARAAEPMFAAILGTSAAHLAVAEGDLGRAVRELAVADDGAAHIKDLPLVAAVGVGAAALRAASGEPGRAAEALGAAHALRGAADGLNPDVVRLTARLRDDLGDDRFATAYERGRALAGPDAAALVSDYARRR
ncbi:BTAD domain-containing putative transcriptional regulator [Jiangella endophytica]|uniref:BTAD domain-containing putative transcriptional regulator n=1 Tax=Jiangella endophytica TaxID=1623398 RepID=UPI000E34F888|nr:BTAD domain-containing putative transcriptional regulator [Jiangella endophytica]